MKKIVEVITQPLSVEAEFEVEAEIRRILALEDLNELRALAALLMKQNACQSHVILEALERITQLEHKIKTLQSRISKLLKTRLPFLLPLKSILNRNP